VPGKDDIKGKSHRNEGFGWLIGKEEMGRDLCMVRFWRIVGVWCFLVAGLRVTGWGADAGLPDLPGASEGSGRVQGIYRLPASSLRVPKNPGGFHYTAGLAFPLTFDQPIGFGVPPGATNQLFVIEKPGRIITLTNLAQPSRTVFLDISDRVFSEQESGLLGIAFHPEYARNGRFYVTYTFSRNDDFGGVNLRLAQFERSPENPNLALPDSEIPLFTQFDGDPWHEGGDLHFGPDGYLYMSVGDGGQYGVATVQRLDRALFGGILRIDVDKRPGNLPPNPLSGGTDRYFIPADNPFVDATHFNGVPVDRRVLRSEFYAMGLRNPWRFSFDPLTGDLYSNDTGSSYREEVNLIRKGANYGWPFTEGSLTHTNVMEAGRKPSTLLPPLAEYGYEGGGAGNGKAIAGGMLYRGDKFPSLDGAYLFSDFWTGDIGLIRPQALNLPARLKTIQERIAGLESDLKDLGPDLEKRQAEWERTWLEVDQGWRVLDVAEAGALRGTRLEEMPDHSLFASGASVPTDTYTVVGGTGEATLRSIRLELLPDSRLPGGGPGRSASGNVVISEVEVWEIPSGATIAEGRRVRLINPSADYSQAGWEIEQTLDGDPANGWAIAPALGRAHQAVYSFESPIQSVNGVWLAVVIRQNLGSGITLGRFRISVSASEKNGQADLFPGSAEILRTPVVERSEEQADLLRAQYRSIDPQARVIQAEIARAWEAQANLINEQSVPIEWIARQTGIASFGLDPRTGDILMTDMLNGFIRRLLPRAEEEGWPGTLQGTGLFSNTTTLEPAPGVVPYSVRVPFWSDRAVKQRWFSLPDPFEKIKFHRDQPWEFPAGTTWIKHFDLQITNGVSSSARRLETRVLVKNDFGIHGATYRWDADGVGARLVPDEGASETILTHYGGAVRSQVWRYPSRAQCLQCHTAVGGYALGFQTAQLNQLVDYDGFHQNQVEALAGAGYLDVPEVASATLPELVTASDANASREFRVRSYLHVNCVQCHQPGGPGRSLWDARIATPRTKTGLIEGLPVHDSDSPLDRLIKPGSLEHSVLWKRLANAGKGHMPPLGTEVLNSEALDLIGSWILQDLPALESYESWRSRLIVLNAPRLTDPEGDFDGDGSINYAEYLLATDPRSATDRVRLTIERGPDRTLLRFPWKANLGFQVQWTEDPVDPDSWSALESVGNRPFYLSAPAEGVIEDVAPPGHLRYYRLTVREP
jgi:glucose/arabinose dehydrogenase/mono/diheme cytochrome c family protein